MGRRFGADTGGHTVGAIAFEQRLSRDGGGNCGACILGGKHKILGYGVDFHARCGCSCRVGNCVGASPPSVCNLGAGLDVIARAVGVARLIAPVAE